MDNRLADVHRGDGPRNPAPPVCRPHVDWDGPPLREGDGRSRDAGYLSPCARRRYSFQASAARSSRDCPGSVPADSRHAADHASSSNSRVSRSPDRRASR
jgi:hypothetical protein